MRVIVPVSGSDSGESTTRIADPRGAESATTALLGTVGVGVPATAVLVGVATEGVCVPGVTVCVTGVPVRVGLGVRTAVGEAGVRVGVGRPVNVNVGVTALQPKSGVRHTPGEVCGVGSIQSALTAQEKSAKSPPSQKRPVEAHVEPVQCVFRRQPKPRNSPPVQTFCEPTQELPAPQLPDPGVVVQGSPAKGPP